MQNFKTGCTTCLTYLVYFLAGYAFIKIVLVIALRLGVTGFFGIVGIATVLGALIPVLFYLILGIGVGIYYLFNKLFGRKQDA